ncbi:MAG: hypothetical protein O3C63_01515 [Cyanobacteria bacterium]|nr:hypothetical protein [Cyanobacteriota bacterium]MDA1019988.1 hypothetical protein [Cyanobacteriota bacterium]
MTIRFPGFVPSSAIAGGSFDARAVRDTMHHRRLKMMDGLHVVSNTIGDRLTDLSWRNKAGLSPATRTDTLELLHGYSSMLGDFSSTFRSAYNFMDTLVSLIGKSTRFTKNGTTFDQAKHHDLLVKSRSVLRVAMAQLTKILNTDVLPLIAETTGLDLAVKPSVMKAKVQPGDMAFSSPPVQMAIALS